MTLAGRTRMQAGRAAFSLHRSIDDTAVVIGIERWASKVDRDRHLQGAHFHKLGATMVNIASAPQQISRYEILDEDERS